MGFVAWGISCALLLATAWRIARRLARDPYAAFWITILALAAQVGAATTILSWFHALTPVGALITQSIFFLASFFLRTPISKAKSRIAFPKPLLLLAPLLLLTLIEQFLLPVSNIDDRNYRASRAAYWLENQSIGAFPTHNERQIAFPPGGSLPFFWSIIFARAESPGLLATWIAYPLAMIGVYILVRELGQSSRGTTVGAALFACVPIVLSHTRGLAPEMWLALFTLSSGFWTIRARREEATDLDCFFAITSAVFACAIRVTALPLLIAVLLLTAIPRMKFKPILAAIVAGVFCSGLLPMLADNIRQFHHPLGSAGFRHVHAADISPAQLRTHAARAILTLIEPPCAPPALQRVWTATQSILLRAFGADAPLPMEDQPWPGHFQPATSAWADNYSLAGVALVFAALVAAARAFGALSFRRPLTDVHVLAILALFFLLPVVFLIRWSGMMGRFWIAPLALCLPVLTTLIAAAIQNRRALRIIACFFAAIVILPAAIARTIDFATALREPSPLVALDEPFAEPLALIDNDATILLIAGQATRDYSLFRPRDGFTNRVVPWGTIAFDPFRLAEVLDGGVTHVLIENDQTVDFHWYPPLPTPPFVRALRESPQFVEIPLEYSPGMRLFQRR